MTDTAYKIVYCTPALYSAGGMERVVSAKASYFADHFGYDVTVIVTEGRGCDSFFPLSDKVRVVNLGLDFEQIWELPFWRKVLLYLRKQRQYKRLLRKWLTDLHPDITITTLRREINFISDIRDGSLKVGEMHLSRANFRSPGSVSPSWPAWLFFRWWQRDLVRRLRRLDQFVVLTDTSLNEWPELQHVVAIPDPLTWQPQRTAELSAKCVLTIGRYADEKGYDLLFQAWHIVQQRFPDWELCVYATGSPERYQQLAIRLGLLRCRLMGSISDVESQYLSSSVFVLPSRFEGFGLVCVEAMACGLPVVAYDCENGPRSIIADGADGYLVPAFDVALFADRLMTLMADPSLRRRMGANGRLKAHQYTIQQVAPQWKCLFDKLMQNHGL